MPPVLTRLLAVDPSLTCSGWALFDCKSENLCAVGQIRPPGPEVCLSERLIITQKAIATLYKKLVLGSTDILIVEAPTTMRDPRAALLVEQVRCIFEVLARSRAVAVPGRLNPRSVQHEVMGLRGKQLRREVVKDSALHTVLSLYGTSLKRLRFPIEPKSLARHQDIIDAILIGNLAVSRVKSFSRGETTLEQHFAMQAPRGRSWKCIAKLPLVEVPS